jgi:hypothetical protein
VKFDDFRRKNIFFSESDKISFCGRNNYKNNVFDPIFAQIPSLGA